MKRRLLSLIGFLCGLGSLVTLVFWPFSYHFYNTFGIDSDRVDGATAVYYRYYRVRWPGDGTIRIGSGAHHYARGEKKIEPFDLGGRFLLPPRTEKPRTFWNRLGFYRIATRTPDRYTRTNPTRTLPYQSWIGVPAWFAPLLLGGVSWLCWRATKPIAKSSFRSLP